MTELRPYADRFAHTYSIVARDPATGEMGVAVQSHWFSVGTVVGWGEAGVGVVATQSMVNPAFGPGGLELLRKGKTAKEAVDELVAGDEAREVRQLAVLDAKGGVAAFTGKRCVPACGHAEGAGFSVQANMMANATVWPAMAKAFENAEGLLAERMIAALEAAEAEGGDFRGRQSAALLVVRGTATGKVWEDRVIDLRVEDDPSPVGELKRLLRVHRAYENMNRGDVAVEKGDMAAAMRYYGTARSMYPENEEVTFWSAATLASNGRMDEALPMLANVFSRNPNWRIALPELVRLGHIKLDSEQVKRILSL
jgi:uncharacterized Ntn-hydrolase superfamily protein